MTKNLSAEMVKTILDYSEETGLFTWRANSGRWGRIKAGSVAGSNSHGYTTIVLDGARHPVHRLAWLVTHGMWPSGEIDHINGMRSDNRIANLRDVPKRINGQNRRAANADNKSCGLLGATPNGKTGWMAQITVDGKRVYIGTFRTAEAAHVAYVEAKRTLHAGCTL